MYKKLTVSFIILLFISINLLIPASQAQSGKVRPSDKKKDQEEIIDKKGETIKIETALNNIEVTVTDKKNGGIYQGLKPGNFAIYEDGVKQEISNFAAVDAPITLVLLLEYSRQISLIRNEVINPAGQFVTSFVRPKDQIAIVAYDARPAVLNDFTDKQAELANSVSILARNVPALNDSNLYDAISFVIKGGKLDKVDYGGIEEIPGRVAILLVSSGFDTFSKLTYDKTLKLVENAGVPIYSIGIGNLFFKLYEARMSDEQRLGFYQAANQLRYFSELSGGRNFPVTFEGEIPSTLRAISALLRSQYSIGYSPNNTRREGKKRKIEVHVDVDGDGKRDDKNLVIQYRKVYTEPKN
jgi:VWFA-related protein